MAPSGYLHPAMVIQNRLYDAGNDHEEHLESVLREESLQEACGSKSEAE